MMLSSRSARTAAISSRPICTRASASCSRVMSLSSAFAGRAVLAAGVVAGGALGGRVGADQAGRPVTVAGVAVTCGAGHGGFAVAGGAPDGAACGVAPGAGVCGPGRLGHAPMMTYARHLR